MKITALEEYGLRCLMQLAFVYDKGFSISEISRKEGLSMQYVSKITSILRKAGLVESTRGLKGGYRLVRDPGEIKISQVSEALGGMIFDKAFCPGHSGKEVVCVHNQNCSIRSVWSMVHEYIHAILEDVTLKDLLVSETSARERVLRVILDKEKSLEREKSITHKV